MYVEIGCVYSEMDREEQMLILFLPVDIARAKAWVVYPRRAEEQAMDRDRAESKLARSIEDLIFGSHATRKNRLDIQRVVTAIVDVVRAEIRSMSAASE